MRAAFTGSQQPRTSRQPGSRTEVPNDSWVGFTLGSIVYTVDLHGAPGSVSQEQAWRSQAPTGGSQPPSEAERGSPPSVEAQDRSSISSPRPRARPRCDADPSEPGLFENPQ